MRESGLSVSMLYPVAQIPESHCATHSLPDNPIEARGVLLEKSDKGEGVFRGHVVFHGGYSLRFCRMKVCPLLRRFKIRVVPLSINPEVTHLRG
jgi:hypothetical protein